MRNHAMSLASKAQQVPRPSFQGSDKDWSGLQQQQGGNALPQNVSIFHQGYITNLVEKPGFLLIRRIRLCELLSSCLLQCSPGDITDLTVFLGGICHGWCPEMGDVELEGVRPCADGRRTCARADVAPIVHPDVRIWEVAAAVWQPHIAPMGPDRHCVLGSHKCLAKIAVVVIGAWGPFADLPSPSLTQLVGLLEDLLWFVEALVRGPVYVGADEQLDTVGVDKLHRMARTTSSLHHMVGLMRRVSSHKNCCRVDRMKYACNLHGALEREGMSGVRIALLSDKDKHPVHVPGGRAEVIPRAWISLILVLC